MISVIYACLGTVLIIWLSLNVIKYRHHYRVSVGDGDQEELRSAIAAQHNAVEYIPLALILLYALELNQGWGIVLHGCGIALIAGRYLHARAMLSENLKLRVLGMQITIYTLIALMILNLLFLPYEKLLQLL